MSESLIVSTNKEDFEKEVLKSDKPTLVDFWAPWCQPCQMMIPALEEVAPEYHDKVKIVKVDITTNESLAEEFNILSIPTLITFKNGQQEKRITGFQGPEQLREILNELSC
jgi:thioredoxin 1